MAAVAGSRLAKRHTYHADADLHYYKVGAFIKPWKLGTGVPGVLERLGDVWRVDEWDNTYHCLRHLQPGNESVFCVFECFDELHEPKACAAGTPESGTGTTTSTSTGFSRASCAPKALRTS